MFLLEKGFPEVGKVKTKDNMNTKDLAKLIKMTVQAEVKRTVRELVKEEVTKAMGSVIAELILSKGDIISEVAEKSTPKVEPQREVVHESRTPVAIKTGNSKLDAILQETAMTHNGIPREESVEYSDLVGRFDKIGQNQPAAADSVSHPETKLEFLKQMTGHTPGAAGAPPSIIEVPGAVPDVLKGVFKKDYSKILKKMDDVKKNGGGNINPGMVGMT